MPDKINLEFISIILEAGSEMFLSLVMGGMFTGALCALIVYFIVKSLLVSRVANLTVDSV